MKVYERENDAERKWGIGVVGAWEVVTVDSGLVKGDATLHPCPVHTHYRRDRF